MLSQTGSGINSKRIVDVGACPRRVNERPAGIGALSPAKEGSLHSYRWTTVFEESPYVHSSMRLAGSKRGITYSNPSDL